MELRQETTATAFQGARTGALLAALLVDPNRPLSVHRLASAVWDGAAPASAASSLANHVARLRRLLGPDGRTRLRTVPPGYELTVGPGELDAAEFSGELRQARAARLKGDWQQVADRTGAALGLWRGTPLSNLGPLGPDLRAEVHRLGEARLEALEWYHEAELELGRHQGLVSGLTRLAHEHPLRETFHGQLMRALHRSGLRAEALAAYQGLRSALVDQLGIDPGPALQRIHQEVLQTSGTIPRPRRSAAAEAPAESRHSRTRPSQIPPCPSHFTGRESEVAGLCAALTTPAEQGRVAVVSGMAGAGKTALALRTAQLLQEQFPDGQLYVNLLGSTTGRWPLHPAQALAALLHDLGHPPGRIPEDVDAAAALLRSTLVERRALLVLDSAACAAQVRPLLPSGPGCAVLVTSRLSLTALDSAAKLRLGPLPLPDALDLIGRASGRAHGELDSPAAARLVELCTRLPLALRIAAARLAARRALGITALVEELTLLDERLDGLEHDDLSVRQSLRVTYDWLCENGRPLDNAAAAALLRMGSVDLPAYTAPAVARLLDTDDNHADRVLNRLAEVALAEECGRGRYTTHELVRAFARELARERAAVAGAGSSTVLAVPGALAATVPAGVIAR
ncbi:BTAD domain-containing putative transcriptional regulator [Kitasatospora sp. NPDC059973]|uniref:AfsR/SARP family transcriptional regulator n=1 Tax=Kitasatospora sp. NPDC059973 TaxID=3347020 RepID=UPI0036883BB8